MKQSIFTRQELRRLAIIANSLLVRVLCWIADAEWMIEMVHSAIMEVKL